MLGAHVWPVSAILNGADVEHVRDHSEFCCPGRRAIPPEARALPQGLGRSLLGVGGPGGSSLCP